MIHPTALVERLRRGLGHPLMRDRRTKRVILLLALAVLIGGTWLSLAQRPDALERMQWQPALLALLVTVPASILFNALEYVLLARQIGVSVPWRNALEITVMSSAANLLPLPGGAMVRIAALKSEGASLKAGTGTTVLGAGIWIGVAFTFAGLWMISIEAGAVAVGLLALGMSALLAAFLYLVPGTPGGMGNAMLVVLNRLFNQGNTALRFFWCIAALGSAPGFAQAAVLSVSGVVGSAVSIVPAGLGIRELVAAALAPAVMLAPATGFLVALLSRVLGHLAMVPLAAYLALRGLGQETRHASDTR